MAGVVADPAFFLDQVGDPRRRPQTALVAQSLRPSLEAAFDAPQVFRPQAGFASRSSGPLQPPQSAFLQLLRPATDGLSMSTDAASHFRLVYALPQQFGRLTAALFQPYEVPANSCELLLDFPCRDSSTEDQQLSVAINVSHRHGTRTVPRSRRRRNRREGSVAIAQENTHVAWVTVLLDSQGKVQLSVPVEVPRRHR